MSTSNCNDIFIATKNPATASPSSIARSSIFRCSPPTASNYATAKARELCDAFTAIRHHRTLSTAGRLLARNSERSLKSPQEMQQLFADLPEAIAIRSNFPPGSNSRSTISATNFRAIPCPKAKP